MTNGTPNDNRARRLRQLAARPTPRRGPLAALPRDVRTPAAALAWRGAEGLPTVPTPVVVARAPVGGDEPGRAERRAAAYKAACTAVARVFEQHGRGAAGQTRAVREFAYALRNYAEAWDHALAHRPPAFIAAAEAEWGYLERREYAERRAAASHGWAG